MTAITFPNSPSSGDTHTAGNGIVYTYDGEKWTSIGTNSAGTWTRSGTEVSLTNAGDDLNVDSGTLFVDASTDRVGVGTTSPGGTLDVKAASSTAPLIVQGPSSEFARIDDSGSLLVGKASTYGDEIAAFYRSSDAARYLYVENPNSGTSASASILVGTGPGGDLRMTAYGANHSSANHVSLFNHNPIGSLLLGTAGTERARIDSSGRLLVGTSSSSVASTAVLQGNSSSSTGNSVLRLQRGDAAPSVDAALGGVYYGDNTGNYSSAIVAERDGGTWSASSLPTRLSFSTTPDGSSSPLSRLKITSAGVVEYVQQGQALGTLIFVTSQQCGFYVLDQAAFSTANSGMIIGRNSTNLRSINAGGTINASGADYAEYMTKAGDFILAKGDVCGVNVEGKLTNIFADAISFVVKSTDPSYVGGDTWGTEEAVGAKPDEDDVDAFAQWEANLEAARQLVDRIAFAGQVPVNVSGTTPGQYIVPIESTDGGIIGIAKNETDLTLADYIRSVGKVIATENDGRARIIVKVA